MGDHHVPLRYLRGLSTRLGAANRSPGLVRAAQALRRHAPGGDALLEDWPSPRSTSGRIARLIAEVGADRPSAARELGITAIHMWQALATRRDLRRDGAEVTTVFTDLVGFSSWALRAGDEQVLRLLRAVTGVSQEAVARHRGTVVKSLGDGLMAVFTDAASAIAACHEMGNAMNAIILDGYRPQLRTGVHTGHPESWAATTSTSTSTSQPEWPTPRPAARCWSPDRPWPRSRDRYSVRRRRTFRAKGAPADLEVFSVVPRYDPGEMA